MKNRFEITVTDLATGKVEKTNCRSLIAFADGVKGCEPGVVSTIRITTAGDAARLILTMRNTDAGMVARHPELKTLLDGYEPNMIIVDVDALREQAGGGQDG